MANTYPYIGPGTRWNEEDATAEDFMNVSRQDADHVHEALNTIMDSDAADGTLLPAVRAPGVSTGAVIDVPSSVESGTDENAKKIIIVDLDDSDQLWDLDEFMQLIQGTSWHVELGDPPIHGAMWITEDQDTLVWWNRETQAIYMQFDAGGTDATDANHLGPTGQTASGIAFLDGIIYKGDSGAADAIVLIDLCRDGTTFYYTDGMYRRVGDITARNGGNGHAKISSTAIVNSTVTSVGVARDAELVDEFGRPAHWWGISTAGGVSVYNPVDDAIYDSSLTLTDSNLTLGEDGSAFLTYDDATRDYAAFKLSMRPSADAFNVALNGSFSNSQADGEDLAWTNAAINSAQAIMPGAGLATVNSPTLLLGSDEGLYLIHPDLAAKADSGLIRMHEDYASPYMKGDIRAAWPLHAVTDVASAGHDLTNNNAVTFAAGGPTGNYANFVAASSMSLTLADHADFSGMAALTFGCWFYRDIDSGGDEILMAHYDYGADDDAWLLRINSSDLINVSIETSAGEDDTNFGPAIAISTWYHVIATYDGATISLYLNGELASSSALSGAVNDSTEPIAIGAATNAATPQNFFDGRIAGAHVSATAMTQREVRAEYQRGLRSLNSTIDTNDTIPDNDVAAITVDPRGKYFAVATDDGKVTIFDALGVPVYQDTLAAGTLRDVAVKSYPGTRDPMYVMAGSTTIEFVQQNIKLIG